MNNKTAPIIDELISVDDSGVSFKCSKVKFYKTDMLPNF